MRVGQEQLGHRQRVGEVVPGDEEVRGDDGDPPLPEARRPGQPIQRPAVLVVQVAADDLRAEASTRSQLFTNRVFAR